jgi:hypothetical protein
MNREKTPVVIPVRSTAEIYAGAAAADSMRRALR